MSQCLNDKGNNAYDKYALGYLFSLIVVIIIPQVKRFSS
jgi:hypothetical protein